MSENVKSLDNDGVRRCEVQSGGKSVSPSPVSISSALPYFGVCLWVVVPAPWFLSTWIPSLLLLVLLV